MTTGSIDIVLFDLGGVLVDVGGVARMKELANIDDDAELWRRWLECKWVRTFERGHCSDIEFATGVIEDWRLPIDPQAFLAGFRSWPCVPMEGAEDLVRTVRAVVPVGCLSNTNVLHFEQHFSRWPLFDAFDFRFLSHELGAVKPDSEAFAHVAAVLPAPPSRVLFLDDNLINVRGAMDAGFVARHAPGVDAARAALTAAGVLPADVRR